MRCARCAESATSPHTEVEIAALKRHLAGQGFEFDRPAFLQLCADATGLAPDVRLNSLCSK